MASRSGEVEGQPDDVNGEEFFALLATSLHTAVSRLHQRLADAGFDDVRPAHGFAFTRLISGQATASELAEHLGVTKQAAGQMVDYLEEHGYVKRVAHPVDRRVKLVELAQRGRACTDLAFETKNEIAEQWSRLAGPGQLAVASAALKALIVDENLSEQRGLRPTW